MKITKTSVALLLLFSTFSFSQSGQKNFIDQPYIEVTGTVETEIIPNEIYLRITLDENDKKGRISVEKQENQMLSKLRALNIDLKKNLSVLDFEGYYKKKFLATNEVVKIKRYQLMVTDGKTLGEVYRALDEIDISNISIIRVSHSEIEKYKRETKLKALNVAKEKANDYAAAIGQTIGKGLFIRENQNYSYANTSNLLVRGNASKLEKIETLNFKVITLTASVMARFILN
ncbi:MAG: SIMPL domain-containing protein [Bacteroidetes bacterium]|nr:SIMPL domain-containing protein [Bacteroidota bacterium]